MQCNAVHESLGHTCTNDGKNLSLKFFIKVRSEPSGPLSAYDRSCLSDFLCFLPSFQPQARDVERGGGGWGRH